MTEPIHKGKDLPPVWVIRHVCVDVHMKRCLEIRLIRAVMRA